MQKQEPYLFFGKRELGALEAGNTSHTDHQIKIRGIAPKIQIKFGKMAK